MNEYLAPNHTQFCPWAESITCGSSAQTFCLAMINPLTTEKKSVWRRFLKELPKSFRNCLKVSGSGNPSRSSRGWGDREASNAKVSCGGCHFTLVYDSTILPFLTAQKGMKLEKPIDKAEAILAIYRDPGDSIEFNLRNQQ